MFSEEDENKTTGVSHFRRLSQFLHRHSIVFPVMTKKEELRRHPRFSRGVRCTHSGWHMGKQRIRFDGVHLEVPDAYAMMGKLTVSDMYARYEGTNIELIQKEPGMQEFVIEFQEEQEAKLWQQFLTQAAKDFASNDQERLLQLRQVIKKQETVLKSVHGLVEHMERKSGIYINDKKSAVQAINGTNGAAKGIITTEVTKPYPIKSTPAITPAISNESKDDSIKANSYLQRRFQRPTPTTSEGGSIKSMPPSLPSEKTNKPLTRSRSSERTLLDTKAASDAGGPAKSTSYSGSSLLQKIAAKNAAKETVPDKSPGPDSISPWQRMLSKRAEDKDGTPSSQQASTTSSPEKSKAGTIVEKSKTTSISLKTFGSRYGGGSASTSETNSVQASEPSSPWQRMLDRRTPSSDATPKVETSRSDRTLSPVPEKKLGMSTARALIERKSADPSVGNDKPRSTSSLTQRVALRIDTLKDTSNK